MPDDEHDHEGDEPEIPAGGVVDTFEGEDFTQRELALGANLALALGLTGTYRRGQKLVVIGTFVIDEIQHKTKSSKPTRVEKGSATELFVVTDSTDALDVLQRARADRERQLDELLGRPKLPGMDDDDGPDDEPAEPGSMSDEEFAEGLKNILDQDGDDDVADAVGDALDDSDDEPGDDE